VTGPNPPLHLLLGVNALGRAMKKLDDLKNEFEKWRAVTVSTDYSR
jgi:hypothetical protein